MLCSSLVHFMWFSEGHFFHYKRNLWDIFFCLKRVPGYKNKALESLLFRQIGFAKVLFLDSSFPHLKPIINCFMKA